MCIVGGGDAAGGESHKIDKQQDERVGDLCVGEDALGQVRVREGHGGTLAGQASGAAAASVATVVKGREEG